MFKNSKKIKALSLILISILLLSSLAGCQMQGDLSSSSSEVDISELLLNGVLQYPTTNENFRYNVYEDFVRITEYIGEDTKVVIPSTIDGLPVYSVAKTTFSYDNYKDDKGVNIDKEMTPIYYIEEIIIEENVYEIEEKTFSGLASLETVSLPKSLHYIGPNAFENCVSLKSLTIPASVSVIPENLCYNCEALASVTIETTPKSDEGSVSEETSEAPVAPNTSLEAESGRSIGRMAFANCYNLRYAWIPEDITFIDDSAFSKSTKRLMMSGYSKGAGALYAANFLVDFTLLDKDKYNELAENAPTAVTTTRVLDALRALNTDPIYRNFTNLEKSITYDTSSGRLHIEMEGDNDLRTANTFYYDSGALKFERNDQTLHTTELTADKFWVESLILIVAKEYNYDVNAVQEWLTDPDTDFSKYKLNTHGIEIVKKTTIINEQEIEYYASVKISLTNGFAMFKDESEIPEKNVDEILNNSSNTSDASNSQTSDVETPAGSGKAIVVLAVLGLVIVGAVVFFIINKKKK